MIFFIRLPLRFFFKLNIIPLIHKYYYKIIHTIYLWHIRISFIRTIYVTWFNLLSELYHRSLGFFVRTIILYNPSLFFSLTLFHPSINIHAKLSTHPSCGTSVSHLIRTTSITHYLIFLSELYHQWQGVLRTVSYPKCRASKKQ
jgi:hypothetical protein